jgi:tRNA(Ile)-lysidine synthase
MSEASSSANAKAPTSAKAAGPSHAAPTPASPILDRQHLRPGLRLAVAVSAGADSVALLRALLFAAPGIGLVLSVAHVHHGLRGADADSDADFVAALASHHGLAFYRTDVDTPSSARINRETIEEAARNLRYQWFRELLASGRADAVATAHTLDDQAETVLHKLLRGAWTEGLGGIHPRIVEARGAVLRPFLNVRRVEIESWLRSLGQSWREDATNADTAFTRNRLRHELLPALAAYNPQIHAQLANLATIARDEDAYWQTELARILPPLLLPGKPVRGGGRAASTHLAESSLAFEIERLPQSPAVRRRILRAAARQLGTALNFDQTERLLAMCGPNPTRRQTLTAELHAERSPRELRLVQKAAQKEVQKAAPQPDPGKPAPGKPAQ